MADVPLVNNPMTAVADSIIGGTVTGGVAAPLRLKNNWSAAVAPTVNEDSGDGYAIGSRWIDTTADKEYVALDVTVGAAVWTETTGGGGGSVATDAIWDAAGDLAVGTGADTAARLPIGTALQTLRVNAGATALEWATPAGGLGAWTSYTPALTASSTNPTLGSSTMTGWYKMLDDGTMAVNIKLAVTTGGAWNAGSGVWFFGLPSAYVGKSGIHQVIPVLTYDNATRFYSGVADINGTAASLTGHHSEGGNQGYIGHDLPMVWATGDFVILSGIIQVQAA